MKKTYIIPALTSTVLSVERVIAASGPRTLTDSSASQSAGMDVKQQRNDYNVWNDDWSN